MRAFSRWIFMCAIVLISGCQIDQYTDYTIKTDEGAIICVALPDQWSYSSKKKGGAWEYDHGILQLSILTLEIEPEKWPEEAEQLFLKERSGGVLSERRLISLSGWNGISFKLKDDTLFWMVYFLYRDQHGMFFSLATENEKFFECNADLMDTVISHLKVNPMTLNKVETSEESLQR